MTVKMVRVTVKPEHAADVEAAAERMFAAIAEAAPAGVRYASTKLADGVTFVNLLHLDEGVENPLLAIPECQQYLAALSRWWVAPPTIEDATVVGSYRLF